MSNVKVMEAAIVGSGSYSQSWRAIPTHRYPPSPNIANIVHTTSGTYSGTNSRRREPKHALGTTITFRHFANNRPTGPLLRESTGCIFNTKGIVLVTQPNLQPECESGRSRTEFQSNSMPSVNTGTRTHRSSIL